MKRGYPVDLGITAGLRIYPGETIATRIPVISFRRHIIFVAFVPLPKGHNLHHQLLGKQTYIDVPFSRT